jgi:hypothetical protein
MSETATYAVSIGPEDRVRVRVHPEWGEGEVLKVSQTLGVYQAKVLFETPEGARVENLPLEWLEKARDLWERLEKRDFDSPEAYCLKQMALDMTCFRTRSCSCTTWWPSRRAAC